MIGRWSWAVVLLCAAALAAGVLVLAVSDPFGWHGRRLERARQAAESGKLEAQLRQVEREAQQELARRQAELQQQQKTVAVFTERAVLEARGQADAEVPLGDDRVRRLREHDMGLCDQAAELGGCSR